MSSSNKKKLSPKEQEILNRQRVLAEARRRNIASAASAASTRIPKPPPPPPPPPHRLPPTTDIASSSSSRAFQNSIQTRPTKFSKSLDELLAPNTSSSKKRKRNETNQAPTVIDLTKDNFEDEDDTSKASQSYYTKNNNNNNNQRPPTKPPSEPSAFKRPTLRKKNTTSLATQALVIRPSVSDVEKTISDSRSRVQQLQQRSHNSIRDSSTSASILGDEKSTKSTSSSSTANTASSSIYASGLTSLLRKAGVKDPINLILENKKNATIAQTSIHHKDDSNGDDGDDREEGTLTMDDYFDNILSWDFLQSINGERMNQLKLRKKKDKKKQQLQQQQQNNNMIHEYKEDREPIPDTFISTRQYQHLWAPLCLDEARAQILSDALNDVSKWTSSNTTACSNNNNNHNENSSNNNINNIRRNNRNGGGDSFTIIPVLASPLAKDVGTRSHNMTITLEPLQSNNSTGTHNGPSYMSNDLIILAKDASILLNASKGILFDKDDDIISNQIKTAIMGCVGVVEYGRKSVEGLLVKVSRKFWLQLTTGKKGEPMVILKLGCNVTNMREFSALCRVNSLPLLPYLLCKKLTTAKDPLDELSATLTVNDFRTQESMKKGFINEKDGMTELGEGFNKYAKEKFNSSQLGAISAAVNGYGGFTLVKGPPGK